MSEAPVGGSASPPVEPDVTLDDVWNESVEEIEKIEPRKYCSRAVDASRIQIYLFRRTSLAFSHYTLLTNQKTRIGKAKRYRSRELRRL